MRNFRKGRSAEKPKQNLNSVETPFHDVSVEVSNLGWRKLWTPLGFTIGVIYLL